ncbi:hypothetical protein C1A50_3592 [Paenibacillus polymyxa]|nr:hypothetical protein C1A50_3592 [Paenibacillus polymyxa]
MCIHFDGHIKSNNSFIASYDFASRNDLILSSFIAQKCRSRNYRLDPRSANLVPETTNFSSLTALNS